MSQRERAYPANFGEGVFHSACEFWSRIHRSSSIWRELTCCKPHSASMRNLWAIVAQGCDAARSVTRAGPAGTIESAGYEPLPLYPQKKGMTNGSFVEERPAKAFSPGGRKRLRLQRDTDLVPIFLSVHC